jgi:drug/metabolite transporter superfamily protein YnfA
MGKLSLAGEVWAFLRQNKKLWLLPIVVVLLLLGALLIFAQSSALAPFIYTIFCVFRCR